MGNHVNTDGYDGPERRRSSGWHVDKTVSISHILTTAIMLVSVILYLADQDKRIDGNSKDIKHNAAAIEQQENRVYRNLDSINQKLDKLTDKLTDLLMKKDN